MRSLRNRLPHTPSTATNEGNNTKRIHKTKKKYEDNFYSSDDLVRKEREKREKRERKREKEREREGRDTLKRKRKIQWMFFYLNFYFLSCI